MESVEGRLVKQIANPKFDLLHTFRLEHEIAIEHRHWGNGAFVNVEKRSLGGFYVDVQFSNHVKTMVSTSLSGYLIKALTMNKEYFSEYVEVIGTEATSSFLSLNGDQCLNEEINEKEIKNQPDREEEQFKRYIAIFHSIRATKLHEVNQHIDKNNMWGDFDLIRSKNTHANGSTVNGIAPKFYKRSCELLNIKSGNGTPLTHYNHW